MEMIGVLALVVIGLGFLVAVSGGTPDAAASDATAEHEADAEELNNWMLSPGLVPWLPNHNDDDD